MIPAAPHVAAMASYALADLKAPLGQRLISLSQNESLRPPSPLVQDAIVQAASQPQLYPDPEWTDLRATLADLHQIESNNILCGSGSMQIIVCLIAAYADAQNAVLAPAHTYPFFRTAAELTQARYDTAPEANGQVCVDALIDAVRGDTRVVCVANPGNPTGTRLPRDALLRLRDGLPDEVLLVIDEAYGEFADHLAEPMFDLVSRGDTVVLRSFSKAYGLAGMRVGWGLFPKAVSDEVRKVLLPNNIPAVAQQAAVAALKDQAYMRETCRITASGLATFRQVLCDAGYDVPHSYTNFALIRFESVAACRAADAALRAAGVFLRPQGGAGLPQCLRATVSAPDDMARAAHLLKRYAAGGAR